MITNDFEEISCLNTTIETAADARLSVAEISFVNAVFLVEY